MKYYAVRVGLVPGIYNTWVECETQVKYFQGAKFKSFTTMREAVEFMNVVVTPIQIHENDDIIVAYCDGACKNNGKSNAVGGVGVWFGKDHISNVSEPLIGERQTNIRAELTAAIRTIEQVNEHYGFDKAIAIHTDSEYTINCITNWIKKWKVNGWKTTKKVEIANKDLIQLLDSLICDRNGTVNWHFVKGHSGIEGNECSDKLANMGCK